MLVYWTENIPAHQPSGDYGSCSTGAVSEPALPIVAVTLMDLSAAEDDAAGRRRTAGDAAEMMKYMMIFFAYVYKVAAGLCVYFITSSLWGFAERKSCPRERRAMARRTTC